MSDSVSHNADATDPEELSWDTKVVQTAGVILSNTLEYDIDDIFNACMVALTYSNAHKLVHNLEHTKNKYDNFMKKEDKIEERF